VKENAKEATVFPLNLYSLRCWCWPSYSAQRRASTSSRSSRLEIARLLYNPNVHFHINKTHNSTLSRANLIKSAHTKQHFRSKFLGGGDVAQRKLIVIDVSGKIVTILVGFLIFIIIFFYRWKFKSIHLQEWIINLWKLTVCSEIKKEFFYLFSS